MPIRPPRVAIQHVEIKGFKSIRNATVELKPTNILIGANGAGKSNFVSFFAFAVASLDGALDSFVNLHGGATAFLHNGAKQTKHIFWRFDVESDEGSGSLAQELSFKAPDSLASIPVRSAQHDGSSGGTMFINDSFAICAAKGHPQADRIFNGIRDGIAVYHFHDTSINGPLRGPADITATLRLDGAGSNLSAVLFSYEQSDKRRKRTSSTKPYSSSTLERITRTVRKFFPGFDRFVLVPEADEQRILLRWRHRESNHIYGPHQFSDGTLRAIALITLLLQPKEDLPNLIVIDEPELGLHPMGIELIAGLIHAASLNCRIIVSTQSTTLLDFFEPEQVVVVEAEKGASRFRRLSRSELSRWLKSYSLSELWRKNVVGGSPLP